MDDEIKTNTNEYIQYGDIIQIVSPENSFLHNKLFINFIDENVIEIIEESTPETIILNIENGTFEDETITSIIILSRASTLSAGCSK